MANVRDTLTLLLKYSSNKNTKEILNDFIAQNEPLDIDDLKGISIPKGINVKAIKSDRDILSYEVYGYQGLIDIGLNRMIMSTINHRKETGSRNRKYQLKVLHNEAKLLMRIRRGRFVFHSLDLMILYLRWWLFLPKLIATYSKLDWVLICPNNVLHIRGRYFWFLNDKSIPVDILKGLQDVYLQICDAPYDNIIKLEHSDKTLLKNLYSEDRITKTLEYGIIDKNIYDSLIANTLGTPIRKRPYSRGINSHYIYNRVPDIEWRSPIYMDDLKNEYKYLLGSKKINADNNSSQIQPRLLNLPKCNSQPARGLGISY